jgi:hypothetical protein
MSPDQTVQFVTLKLTQHDGLSRSRHGSLRSTAIGQHSISETEVKSALKSPEWLAEAWVRRVGHFRRPEVVESGRLGGCAAGAFGLPGPRQQAVEFRGFDVAGDDALEHIL